MKVQVIGYREEKFTSKAGKDITKGLLVGNKAGSEHLVAFTVWGDAKSICETLKKDDMIDVEYDIQCRQWKSDKGIKYFTDAVALSVALDRTQPQSAPPQSAPQDAPEDDLPF